VNLGTNGNFRRLVFVVLLAILSAVFFAGCGDNVTLPTSQQLDAFNNAGPIQPELDLDILVNSKISHGVYRITIGDMVEIQMPQVLQIVTAEYNTAPINSTGHFSRVFDNGMLTMPIIGQLPASGLTIPELEEAVINAYYPKYCINRPSVVAIMLLCPHLISLMLSIMLDLSSPSLILTFLSIQKSRTVFTG
jgi:hypothetical protein